MGGNNSNLSSNIDWRVTHLFDTRRKLVLNIASNAEVFFQVSIVVQRSEIRSLSKRNCREDFVLAARGRWFHVTIDGGQEEPFSARDMLVVSEEEKENGFDFRSTKINLPPLIYAAVIGVLMTNVSNEERWQDSDEEEDGDHNPRVTRPHRDFDDV